MAGETLFFIIGGILLVGVIVWYLNVLKKKSRVVSPLAPNVVNLNPHLMGGHRCGFELKTEAGEDGEHVVTVIPNDYLPDIEGNTIDKIRTYTFVLGKHQRVEIGPGRLGGQKSLVIYLPASFRKLDRQIAESEFGQMLARGLEHQEFENQVYYYLRKIETRMQRLLIAHPDKATALANAEIKDSIQDALSSLSLKKDDEKKSSFGDRYRDRGLGGY